MAAPATTPSIADFFDPSRTDLPKIPFSELQQYWTKGDDSDLPWNLPRSSPTWTTLMKVTPLPDHIGPPPATTTLLKTVLGSTSLPSDTTSGVEDEPSSWQDGGEMSNGSKYAVAAATPVIVLGIIGMGWFFMRKRRRQRRAIIAAQNKADELKLQPRSPPTTSAYMAPPAPLPQSSPTNTHLLLPPNPALTQPIILGPISSGDNGAYFTGIDTSDGVSMASANQLRPAPQNPVSDNDSIVEPPPPYRPRSIAPPSLTECSRQSSLRVAAAPSATSRTNLIERSPFSNRVDDEVISEMSGPVVERGEDALSAVSDLSYQNDPVVNGSPV
ncbi:hypothetical protein BDU57DRAFT_295813 [Ampelomyces quisqualis]|uniref:Uncharacterized protein n=1 Tax=Ampelomyces quisqualis TaxID=50730 RepID=A0A6A5QJ14_AMPQU|nr:hypothetical protein BDU57DRAFT_295813 [Ampelomyces quisqualis]